MSEYILPHELAGERTRLALMSELLDPFHCGLLEKLGLQPGWSCLEAGCGNGSISQWMADRVGPGGHVVAADIDLLYITDLKLPNLESRQINILTDWLEEGAFEVVTARAVLHHITLPEEAIARMLRAIKPGGVFLSIEPDMLPITVAEPDSVRAFWQGWLRWSASVGVDYFIGRKLPRILAAHGLVSIGAEGNTALFNGGSPWAEYFINTFRELRPRLLQCGFVTEAMFSEFEAHYADPVYWTSAITFVASWGRKPA
jgi:2-polyprenyl-3-methyl-5-hydroxy-6-metoxy-1,4-benzoquinol methylase